MTAIRLVVMAPLFLAMLLLHAIPFLHKRARLFGVDVAPEIRYGREGSRIIRRYELWLLPFTLGAGLIPSFGPPDQRYWWQVSLRPHSRPCGSSIDATPARCVSRFPRPLFAKHP